MQVEQAVWLYVGIIAGLLGLGFVASIILTSSETSNRQAVENSVRKMQQNCNLVCASDTETMFSVDITAVAGSKFYSSNKSICADYAGRTNCSECDCSVFKKPAEPAAVPADAFLLDLSGPEAMQLFRTHNYKCFMERFEEGVTVECKG